MSMSRRKCCQILADLIASLLASLLAFSIWHAYGLFAGTGWRVFLMTAAVLAVFRVVTLWRMQLYRVYWNFMGFRDLFRIAESVVISSTTFMIAMELLKHNRILSSEAQTLICNHLWGSLLLDTLLAGIFIASIRIGIRVYGEKQRFERHEGGTRALIVGAGRAGSVLARNLELFGDYQLVGYLDDDPMKKESIIHGRPVLGTLQDIQEIILDYSINEVIVAISDEYGQVIRRVVKECEQLMVRLRIFGGFDSVTTDRVDRDRIRDIAVEDLLHRDPVKLNLKNICEYLEGETVLISGGGGSIGSELCRQVARFKPRSLILLGHGENSIFEIEQQLRADYKTTPIAVICDVKDSRRLDQIFDKYRPTVVFHAAAHKHVPLMEKNPGEAVKNNVIGTLNLARTAHKYGIKRFVMISTDKAVNPTNVMGCTKRICEKIILAANAISDTNYMAVRFGNVLGSRGSVIPTMKKQILKGGPVTVTHPDIIRYFMTIPEAVQLVLQAGSFGKGGELFLLDMGEPVKILDLAKSLIRLSGLVPGRDIEIKITGLRPGEKLYEELLTAQEGTTASEYKKIYTAAPSPVDHDELLKEIADLKVAAESGDDIQVRTCLKKIVPEYQWTPEASAFKSMDRKESLQGVLVQK